MNQDASVYVWPEDQEGKGSSDPGPDHELAIVLLAAGMPQSFIRQRCKFETQRAVQAFCRDEDVRREAAQLATERARRLGRRASVRLEEILATPQTDLRALVLAIRTGLEVSGDLKRDHSAPAKSVKELTSGELGELIEATRQELESRLGRQRADREAIEDKR